MEGFRSKNLLTRSIAHSNVLSQDPFVLVDIGCAGGISKGWRDFEPHLVAYGIEPMAHECERLRAQEKNPNVSYHDYFLELPKDDPYWNHSRPRLNVWPRLSTAWAMDFQEKNAPLNQERILKENQWHLTPGIRDTESISLDTFIAREEMKNIDFIKIDVDGKDMEILLSAQNAMRSLSVLGVGIEVNFHGSHHAGVHTFHNVDRLMRENGFDLFFLSTRSYSLRALPSPFIYFPMQTRSGRPIQGDAIYFRDLAAPQNRVFADSLTDEKLLKTACLFEAIGLPDAAAEVLTTFSDRLSKKIDLEGALNHLVPRSWGRKKSYRSYIQSFQNNPKSFMSFKEKFKQGLNLLFNRTSA